MRIFGLLCTFFFVMLSHLQATNYYVSTSGSNMNSGLTLGSAFATIQWPIDQSLLMPGDTVFVTNGTYAGFDNRDASGTAGNPVVFKADGTAVQITSAGPIRGDGINLENVDYNVIDGFIVNNMPGNANGIRLVVGHHLEVRNCTTIGNGNRGIFTGFTDDVLIEYNTCANSVQEHGIYVSNSSDRAVIRYNTSYGNNGAGIHLNADLDVGGDGISEDFEIYGNLIYENGSAAGINMDGIINAKVFNNVIINNHSGQGIALFKGNAAVTSTGAQIYNNTILVPSDGRWGILFEHGAEQDAIIYNNIILTNHTSRGSITTKSTIGFVSDYNIVVNKMNYVNDNPGNNVTLAVWQTQTNQDQHSIVAGAFVDLFEDLAGSDFRLKVGADALDVGTAAVAAVVDVDFLGLTRPSGLAYDIGAYERNAFLDSDCVTEVLVVDDPVTLSVYDQAFDLNSSATITPAAVVFKAEQAINLMPDFEVPINNTFTAEVLPCSAH